jgi:hypothetical protein
VTLSTIISMMVGLVVPMAIVVLTKATMPAHVRVLVVLFLTTLSGVLSSLLGAVPTTLSAWEHVLLNMLMTYLSAAAADWASWRTGTATRVARATARFGIGPRAAPVVDEVAA